MDPRLHPSVWIHPTARLGKGVVIYPNVTINANVRIGDYSVIGGMPEHRDFYGDNWWMQAKGVTIFEDVRIFEFVTIHAGTKEPTCIDNGASIQNHSHVGHDCFISKNALIGGSVTLAGHVYVMEGATVAGRCAVHQKSVVGAYSILSATSYLKGHVPPGEKWIGNPARPAGLNDVALQRNKMTHEECLREWMAHFEETKRSIQ